MYFNIIFIPIVPTFRPQEESPSLYHHRQPRIIMYLIAWSATQWSVVGRSSDEHRSYLKEVQ